MLSYIYAFCAVVCIGLQFACTKFYQKVNGATILKSLLFTLLSGLVLFMLFISVNKFKIEISVFSIFMALAMALISILTGILSISVMSLGKVSLFTTFMMLGGMVLPFIYGVIFLAEKVSVFSMVGLGVLIVSLVLPVTDKIDVKKLKKLILCCILVFVLNGCCSIISKAHQININAIPTIDYLIFNYLFTFVVSGLLIISLTLYKKILKRNRSHQINLCDLNSGCSSIQKVKNLKIRYIFTIMFIIILYALFSGGGYILQLFSAISLPATVLYPIITGGTVFLGGIIGRIIFKESITKKSFFSMCLALVSAILFVF